MGTSTTCTPGVDRHFRSTSVTSSCFATRYPFAPKLSASFTKSGLLPPSSKPKSSNFMPACETGQPVTDSKLRSCPCPVPTLNQSMTERAHDVITPLLGCGYLDTSVGQSRPVENSSQPHTGSPDAKPVRLLMLISILILILNEPFRHITQNPRPRPTPAST